MCICFFSVLVDTIFTPDLIRCFLWINLYFIFQIYTSNIYFKILKTLLDQRVLNPVPCQKRLDYPPPNISFLIPLCAELVEVAKVKCLSSLTLLAFGNLHAFIQQQLLSLSLFEIGTYFAFTGGSATRLRCYFCKARIAIHT